MHCWDELESTLVQRGVAPRYARRLREELSDHAAALADEYREQGLAGGEAETAAQRALGGFDALVAAALASPRAPSLARTQPCVVFLFAPLVAAVTSLAAAVALACGCAWAVLELAHFPESGVLFRAFANAWYVAIAFVITPALALVFCAQAWLSRASMGWALAACLTLAALGGLLVLGYHVASPSAPSGSTLVGLGWELRALRFALPIASFLAFVALVRHPRGAALVQAFGRFAV